MSFKMRLGFALKSLRADALLQVPYVIAMGLMLSLFLMMYGLIGSGFVQQYPSLITLMRIGVVVIIVLAFVFAVYANRFLMRRRHKEYALYGILGLEKHHIVGILFLEQFLQCALIFLIAIAGGFVFGRLSFVIVNRMLGLLAESAFSYSFPFFAVLRMLAFMVLVFGFIFLRNVRAIDLRAPLNALEADRVAEAEPKTRPLKILFGFLLVGAGYAVSFLVRSPFESLFLFLPAVLAVIIGTYWLFVAFSVLVLKRKKRTRRYYEHASTFLSTSGMLFRMKSHAVGLASVSILLTGILVTLSSTISLFGSIDTFIQRSFQHDYQATYYAFGEKTPSEEELRALVQRETEVIRSLDSMRLKGEVNAVVEGDFQVARSGNTFNVEGDPGLSMSIVKAMSAESYTALTGNSANLESNQVLLAKSPSVNHFSDDRIQFGTMNFDIAGTAHVEIPAQYATDFFIVVVRDYETLLRMSREIVGASDAKAENVQLPLYLSLQWDGEPTTSSDPTVALNDISWEMDQKNRDLTFMVDSREQSRRDMMEIDGGFLFLGFSVTLLFLIGTILVTYFKQVAEAWEDRRQFAIMREMGLPESLIRKTTRQQIIWLFGLPLIVALMHTLAASPILTKLLYALGVIHPMQFFIPLAFTMLGLSALYFVVFQSTSAIYNRIVAGETAA